VTAVSGGSPHTATGLATLVVPTQHAGPTVPLEVRLQARVWYQTLPIPWVNLAKRRTFLAVAGLIPTLGDGTRGAPVTVSVSKMLVTDCERLTDFHLAGLGLFW
jgi:hypothetical protein